jgi:hypothetical protein
MLTWPSPFTCWSSAKGRLTATAHSTRKPPSESARMRFQLVGSSVLHLVHRFTNLPQLLGSEKSADRQGRVQLALHELQPELSYALDNDTRVACWHVCRRQQRVVQLVVDLGELAEELLRIYAIRFDDPMDLVRLLSSQISESEQHGDHQYRTVAHHHHSGHGFR